MKKVFFIVLVLISVVAARCGKDITDKSTFDPALVEMMKDSICPLECPGVCAANNITYCNECEAMKAGYLVAAGDTIPCGQK
jgi:hypothetical protein